MHFGEVLGGCKPQNSRKFHPQVLSQRSVDGSLERRHVSVGCSPSQRREAAHVERLLGGGGAKVWVEKGATVRIIFGIPNGLMFRSAFGLFFYMFGFILYSLEVIFEAIFGPWTHFGSCVGSFLGQQKWLEAPPVPQVTPKRRHPRNKVTNLDPSWGPKPVKIDQKSMPRCVQILHRFSD